MQLVKADASTLLTPFIAIVNFFFKEKMLATFLHFLIICLCIGGWIKGGGYRKMKGGGKIRLVKVVKSIK